MSALRAQMRRAVWVSLVACSTMSCDALKSLTGKGDASAEEGGALASTPASPSGSGTTSAGPTLTSILPSTENAWGVAIDATDLYLSRMNNPEQGIRKRPRAAPPNTPTTSVCKISDSMQSPQTVYLDATHAYVITTSLGAGAVYRAPKTAAGVECEKVAGGLDFLVNRGITKIGSTIYVVGGKKGGGALLAIDAAGKSKTIAELTKPGNGLTTDGASLFFGSREAMTDVRLMKIAPTGGAPSEIFKVGAAVNLELIDGRLYFIAEGLQSVAVTGGEPAKTGKPGGYAAFAIVGGRAYVGGQSGIDDGFVSKGTVGAAELAKHASFKGGVVAMAADAKDIYVTTTRKDVLRIAP